MHLYRAPFVLAVIVVATCLATVQASAQAPLRPAPAQNVIGTYYGLLNADMKTGDFTDLSTVYAPDAVLTQSTALGVTKVFRGLPAIMAYYKAVYGKLPNLHFTLTVERLVTPAVFLRYETAATPTMTVPARCAHLFVVRNGMIVTDDWVTYFPGK